MMTPSNGGTAEVLPPQHATTEEWSDDVQKNACSSDSSATKWFQVAMFLAFTITLVIGVFQGYDALSSGLIWGACLSFVSVVFVIISYLTEPSYRRHPNPLIFWRTIADAIFVLRLLSEQFFRCQFFDCKPLCNASTFQCGCSPKVINSGNTCSAFAGILEFSLIAAEFWFFCMSINLYFSLTNPFTDFKRNTKLYHLLCWGTGLILAILLTSIDDLAGYSDLGLCWTNILRNEVAVNVTTCSPDDDILTYLKENRPGVLNANWISWAFFYLWMFAFIVVGVVVWLWAWSRLSEGLPETYAVRVKSINRARFYVFAVTIYWLTVVAVYVPYLSTESGTKRNKLYELMNFLLASKGYLDLVVWFALNDFKVPRFHKLGTKNPQDVDIDLNPQVNAVLRREVLFYTTSGIVQAVEAARRLPATQRKQHLALLPRIKGDNIQENNDAVFGESIRVSKKSQRTKTFHDYEPHAFHRIRTRFGVDNERYIQSLSSTAKERLSEGASGAFMFFSGDGSLIVKSASKEECRFLRSIAEEYANYLCANPHSLLTRFYGCHCLELYGQQFSFVVMANLFDTDQVIHSRYDIKGSWVNRNADLPKRGKKVTCRHCNRKYIYLSTSYNDFNCPLRLGGHEPNVVLKDNDLTQKLCLDEDVAMDLYRQIDADIQLLDGFGVMDYSLLMGVHDVEYVVSGGEFADDPSCDLESMDGMLASASPDVLRDRGEDATSTTNGIPPPLDTEHARPPFDGGVPDPILSTLAKDTPSTKGEDASQSGTRGGSGSSGRSPRSQRSRTSQRTLPQGGMRMADSVVGPSYYHLGIIDILQTWTLAKQVERTLKILLKRVDGDGLSAVPPPLYRGRFMAKISELLGVQHLVEEEETINENIFSQQNTHMDIAPSELRNEVQMMRSLPTHDHLLPSMDRMAVAARNPNSSAYRTQTIDEKGEENDVDVYEI